MLCDFRQSTADIPDQGASHEANDESPARKPQVALPVLRFAEYRQKAWSHRRELPSGIDGYVLRNDLVAARPPADSRPGSRIVLAIKRSSGIALKPAMYESTSIVNENISSASNLSEHSNSDVVGRPPNVIGWPLVLTFSSC